MGLLSELTYTHMEVFTALDAMERALSRARRSREDKAEVGAILREVVPQALLLRQRLKASFEREREHLYPRVRRIFGSEVEEIGGLKRYADQILDQLDHFIDELPSTGEDRPHPVRLAYLALLFDELAELYEMRTEIERRFYECYSTIVFPGGATTD
ncbi:hypothetical protein DL240_17355 [Lujinxingia litoralis]|uniref:Hemerythrin-like domain-containing protein n=1 Tax=Lujinxingia litoralis TaxID=2211119 RepID=A0A328C244_9DELT|nr:hypothetical protein [Lujinxingia litoralis]RAL20349.1 hypothetical protein DL240_17355 [Lujinxingia litoralis]